MKIKQIKKRLEIINEKIERIEELEAYITIAQGSEYYGTFGSDLERKRDIATYQLEIDQIKNAVDSEIEMLNQLK